MKREYKSDCSKGNQKFRHAYSRFVSRSGERNLVEWGNLTVDPRRKMLCIVLLATLYGRKAKKTLNGLVPKAEIQTYREPASAGLGEISKTLALFGDCCVPMLCGTHVAFRDSSSLVTVE